MSITQDELNDIQTRIVRTIKEEEGFWVHPVIAIAYVGLVAWLLYFLVNSDLNLCGTLV